MDPFSITVGSLTLIESCLKIGKILVQKYDAYKTAGQDIAETLIKLKALWNKSEMQMDLLKEIWDSLATNHKQNQLILLSLLESKLQKAVRLLDSVIGSKPDGAHLSDILRKKGEVHRSRYAFSVKESLNDIVTEFVDWQYIFDPSWYLLARVTSENLDRYIDSGKSLKSGPTTILVALRKAIQDLTTQSTQSSKEIPFDDFLEARHPIACSSAAVSQFNDNNNYAIVDSVTANPLADIDTATKDVKALCKALSRMDPSAFGLLRCCGVINKSRLENGEKLLAFDLVFEIPKGLTEAQSLRSFLMHPRPSLNVRLAISRQLASSVLYLHAAGFVHKNIRPDTILLFNRENSWDKKAFLVGFESFRMSDSASYFTKDTLWERELYRHPSRQGNHPQETHVLQHDVYSLGVCLLEIGLWTPFVQQGTTESGFIPGAALTWTDILKIANKRKEALAVKKGILKLAEEQLPGLMGAIFTNVVVTCLTCLDELQPLISSRESNSADIEAGVQFIEDVLTKLQEIAV